jgi:hypothetical protein
MTRTRTGLLVIRAWVEPASASPLRAQIRLTTDVSVGLERSRTVTQADALIEIVQSWLSEMVAAPRVQENDPGGA